MANTEEVVLTIRFWRDLDRAERNPHNYSPVEYEVENMETSGPLDSTLMRTAIKGYTDIDIHKYYEPVKEIE